ILQRCPRCRGGKVFHGMFGMYERCPECGMRFQRDQGYFLGAMYVSYPISAVLMLLGLFAGQLLLPEWRQETILLLIVLPCYLFMVPLVFRYSRLGWIYFDRCLSSDDLVELNGWEQWCRIWEEQNKHK